MKELDNDVNLVIVQKSKMEDWIEHFKLYPSYKVYNLRMPAQLKKYLESDEKRIGVINYSLTFRRPDILNLKDITLILDESSHIRNPTAKRTKFVMDLDVRDVILLSGTPASGGKYEELHTQAKLLGWNITKKEYYRRFIKTYRIDVGGFPIEVVSGYKNVEELKEELARYGAVFIKTDEVMDMPDMIDNDIVVKRSAEYNRFIKDQYVEVEPGIELLGNSTLEQMLYERQLCGLYSKNKMAAFKEHIEGTNDRLIVFYNFTEELNRLLKEVDRPVSIVNGAKRDLEAYENESDSITFIQYQAGAMGLNLQKANKTIYYTPPLSSELFIQSQKRTNRIGQDRPCFYYYMKVEGSVEDKIYQSIQQGRDYNERLFKKSVDR